MFTPQAGLFSAVSSAFVLDVQSKLQPDPGDQSVAYLRAILLTLNHSAVPDEQVVAPPSTWGAPPPDPVSVLGLLYASLLISLLAAFIAMLGKQWLNRYLRHAGGSITERCGDRQRKLDGLEKWSFRLLIDSLPVMLQVALFFLSCGLSQYLWSINASVGRGVIAVTALTITFYLVIVVVGTSSYDCPYQTPASIYLRSLQHNEGVHKFFTAVSPSMVFIRIHTAGTNTRNYVMSAFHRLGGSPRNLISSLSVSGAVSGVRRGGRNLGHRAILSFLRLDRGLRNAKRKFARGILHLKRTLFPIHAHPLRRQLPQQTNLHLVLADINTPSEKNLNDARCVCWLLRSITDPEAIDSAIRLAATVRWFQAGVDADPPYGLIVTVFNSCFDSSWNLYPGMRNRAYSSARAMLVIYMSALAHCPERASGYSLRNYHNLIQSYHQDPDLKSILRVVANLSYDYPPFQDFIHSRNTPAHTLWMTDLYLRYVWSQRNNLNPCFHGLLTSLKVEYEDWHTFPAAAVANLLLTRCLFLGSPIGSEMLFNMCKSSVVPPVLHFTDTYNCTQ